MRTFLFLCAAVSLLISAHKFSLVDASGQYKSALFFLLIGIQMLITGALIGDHQDEQASKSSTFEDKKESKESGLRGGDKPVNQAKQS
jgi:hypothetical protein